ncbi:MAG: MarR family transcriptional regulator [Planctomycetota bacterium]
MASPEDVAELVARFGKAYSEWMHAQLQEAGTTPARARLLAALKCGGGARMSDLSDRLEVTPRNITKLVDGLESEGLVRREADPGDRRATIVGLTPDGEVVTKESMLRNEATLALFRELSDRDRADFVRVLQRLLEALDQRTA